MFEKFRFINIIKIFNFGTIDNPGSLGCVVNTPMMENNSLDLKPEIKDIKEMDNYFFNSTALDKYETLLISNSGEKLNSDDIDTIYLEILTISLNLSNKKKILQYIDLIKTRTLSEPNNFLFSKLKSIYYFNNNEYDKLINELNSIKDYKKDPYLYAMDIAANFVQDKISYHSFLAAIDSFDYTSDANNKESYSLMFFIYSNALRTKGYLEKAIDIINKALDYDNNIKNRLALALCFFQLATKNATWGDKIIVSLLNYEYLIKSKMVLDKTLVDKDLKIDVVAARNVYRLYGIICFYVYPPNKKHKILTRLIKKSQDPELIRLDNIYFGNDNYHEEYIGKLNEDEQFCNQLQRLFEEMHYKEIIMLLKDVIWSKYEDNVIFHYILLNAYLENDNLRDFHIHIVKCEDKDIKSDHIYKIKANYYYKKHNTVKVEECLIESIENYKNPLTYILLMDFYMKYKMNDKLNELVEKIINKDTFVLNIYYDKFYDTYIRHLISTNELRKAYDVLNSCSVGENELTVITYYTLKGQLDNKIHHYIDAANNFLQVYRLKPNNELLYYVAYNYFLGCDFDNSKKYYKHLLDKGFEKKEDVYLRLSNIELIQNNISDSLNYIERAKDCVINNPKSEIHIMYITRTAMYSKDILKRTTAAEHLVLLKERFPLDTEYCHTITTDELSKMNENISTLKSTIDYDSQNKNSKYINVDFISMLDFYKGKNTPIITNLNTYDEYINECNLLNDKNNIVIDCYSLYILSITNLLFVLRNFESVYITYSSIHYLLEIILNREDMNIRKILSFIKNSSNIILYGINIEFVTDHVNNDSLKCLYKENMDDYILDSLVLSFYKKIPYLYSEPNIVQTLKCNFNNYITITALLNKLDAKTKNYAILQMHSNNIYFDHFTSDDIMYAFKKGKYEINEEMKSFFKFNTSSDFHYLTKIYCDFFENMYNLNLLKELSIIAECFITEVNKSYKKTIHTRVIYDNYINSKPTYDIPFEDNDYESKLVLDMDLLKMAIRIIQAMPPSLQENLLHLLLKENSHYKKVDIKKLNKLEQNTVIIPLGR